MKHPHIHKTKQDKSCENLVCTLSSTLRQTVVVTCEMQAAFPLLL